MRGFIVSSSRISGGLSQALSFTHALSLPLSTVASLSVCRGVGCPSGLQLQSRPIGLWWPEHGQRQRRNLLPGGQSVGATAAAATLPAGSTSAAAADLLPAAAAARRGPSSATAAAAGAAAHRLEALLHSLRTRGCGRGVQGASHHCRCAQAQLQRGLHQVATAQQQEDLHQDQPRGQRGQDCDLCAEQEDRRI